MSKNELRRFLELVLQGFLSRNFPPNELESPDVFEAHLRKYLLFIEDPSAPIMREKALSLVAMQNQLEDLMRRKDMKLSANKAIELIVINALDRVKEKGSL